MKIAALFLSIFVAFKNTEARSVGTLGQPEANLLTRDSRNQFIFTGYPNINAYGQPYHVADEQSRVSLLNYQQYVYQTKYDSSGVAYLKVDLKQKYYVRAFAVSGYADGNGIYKPTGDWYLEGSNDELVWKMVGIAKENQWLSPGTYPFRDSQIVKCLYPAKYRYYRIIARGWTHPYMIINNIGLFQ